MERIAPVVIGSGIVRLQNNCSLEAGNCSIELFELLKYKPKVRVVTGIIAIDFNGLTN